MLIPAPTAPLTIAMGSQKGGVSKTTTTLSLGACLADANGASRRVLLIDLDPQANLTMALGLNPAGLRRMVGDALLEQSSLLAVSRESAVPNLDLVPANQGLLMLDKALFGRPGFEYRLKQQLSRPLAAPYDVVLCDCPPAFGTLTLNALTAADLLVIPVACEYFAARSLQQFLELIQLVKRNTNPRLRYRILITMFDKRNRISHVIHDQLRAHFGDAVFSSIISIDTKLRESPVVGQPITHYAPHSRGADDYRALAAELLQFVSEWK
jgi:chromosome partitioning protein